MGIYSCSIGTMALSAYPTTLSLVGSTGRHRGKLLETKRSTEPIGASVEYGPWPRQTPFHLYTDSLDFFSVSRQRSDAVEVQYY
jgi:hypothetical protein